MKMASGVAPVGELREAGVVVGLGTDGPANNNGLDLFGEMKAACLLQNISRRAPGSLRAEDALEMATIDGARAIGQGDRLGSLEEGKQADIVLIDLARPNTWPAHDPVANIVFAARASNVDTVIVDGQVLMRGGAVTVCDEAEVIEEAAAAATALSEILPSRTPRWPVL
ncbi:MAG TPA: amidohydrolase family protein, partial [Acidimicrobiales bacterium]|nr:amidohydrolase family protein [Acidimicrobiales bacterium]